MTEFNLGQSFGQGVAIGNAVQQTRQKNALADIYSQHGAGIAAGDPTAMNALAGLDPMQVYKLQRQRDADARTQAAHDFDLSSGQERLSMAREKHGAGMKIDQARLDQIGREAEAAMRQHAAQMSEAERAAEAQQTQAALARGKAAFIQGEAAIAEWVQQYGAELAEAGVAPEAVTVGNFPEILKVIQVFDNVLSGGQVDLSGMVPEQPGFRPATQEEAAAYGARAGQFDTESGRFYPINPPKGSRIQVGPDGSVVIAEGAGVGMGEEPSVGDVYDPGEVQGTLDLIDEIATDPTLDRIVGPVEGGGGNDVANLNVMQRSYYGGDGLGAIQKINQLQSRSWLAARAMLKGGGPITDYESRKAEAAVARLERAQGETEFRQALTDLRDAITEGRAKLEAQRGQGGEPNTNISGMDAAQIQDLMQKMPPDQMSPELRGRLADRLRQIQGGQ